MFIETSANISEYGARTKVRANFRSKKLDKRGGIVEVCQIEDEQFYVDFFSSKLAGITGFRFYDLRHTTGTRMIETGSNIVAVKNVLGHADLKTTMRYVHPEDSVKDAMENLENFNQECSKNCSNEKTSEV